MKDLERMTTMSDLPGDLIGEIFSRVPLKSLRAMRSTSKTWNVLSKSQIVGKGAARKRFVGFAKMDRKVCSLSFTLEGIRNDGDLVDPCIKQVSILDQEEFSQVFQCGSLLLCVTQDQSRLLVWNPYLGQKRWIESGNKLYAIDEYALGYDKYHGVKILRFTDLPFTDDVGRLFTNYRIYDFNSNSWRDFEVDWDIYVCGNGVSLNGNIYYVARREVEYLLVCFDFTAEKFGPHLPLPFHTLISSNLASLSCVRDEKLAVLYQNDKTVDIWITTKIEPYAVSWTKFLRVNITSLTADTYFLPGSFFIDEENQVAVVFGKNEDFWTEACFYQKAHIIGVQDGILKSLSVGKRDGLPLECSSYTPSLMQLQINQST